MSKQLQLRGGTTAEHSTFTGAVREVTVDTDKNSLVVHDGSTAGGYPIAKTSDLTIKLENVVEDTTPQLGGDLDLNSNDITGTGNINITGTADITGVTTIVGNTDITGTLDVSAAAVFADSVTVDGNFTVNGTTTTISAENLSIEDSMVYLNQGSTSTNPDLGWAGNYNDGTYAHLGVFADATDSNKFKFYKGYTPEPGSAIDTSHASYTPATVVAGTFEGNLTGNVTGNVTGNLTGNVTGNADTCTTASAVVANSVALGTDTTGNYVATVTAGDDITVTGSGSETAGVTVDHSDITRTNTTDTGTLSHSGTFTAITGVTTNARGHVTGAETTTYTLPAGAIPNDATITISAGSGMTGGGNFTTDQSSNETITITHSDTSSASSVNNSGATVIQDVTIDGFGHVTALGSKTLTASDVGAVTSSGVTSVATSGGLTGGTITSTGTISVSSDCRPNSNQYFGGASGEYTYYDNSNALVRTYVNSAEVMRLYGGTTGVHFDGNVIAYSTTISDERLKENVVKIGGALDKISNLNGYTFNYKADGKVSAGVIAQEVEKVLPEAVSESELGLHTNDDGQEYKVVNYDALHGLLIEAIKELKAEVEDLKTKVK
jgi:hypothetical protein